MNLVIMDGRLGDAPFLRETTNGKSVCQFRLANNESYTDSAGEKHTITEWNTVECWGVNAINCQKYLKKGSKVTIQGYLKTEVWIDKNNVKRTTKVISADRVQFEDSKPNQTKNELPTKLENKAINDELLTDTNSDELPVTDPLHMLKAPKAPTFRLDNSAL